MQFKKRAKHIRIPVCFCLNHYIPRYEKLVKKTESVPTLAGERNPLQEKITLAVLVQTEYIPLTLVPTRSFSTTLYGGGFFHAIFSILNLSNSRSCTFTSYECFY